jgi:nucleoside-diphosphate kinase
MVWEGRDAVKTGRGTSTLCAVSFPSTNAVQLLTVLSLSAILGATNPLASSPGTIRGDYAIE